MIENSHGNIVSRFTNDMDNISIAISAAFNQLFSGVAIVLLFVYFYDASKSTSDIGRSLFHTDYFPCELDALLVLRKQISIDSKESLGRSRLW